MTKPSLPESGGSYLRDPKTGALSALKTDPPEPAPDPAAPVPSPPPQPAAAEPSAPKKDN